MAKRPENTRLINVFNYGVDKRIPLGLVDQVIDKKTGNLVGFMKGGKFYNLGDKVEDEPKVKEEDSSKDINFKIKLAEIRLEKNENDIYRYEIGTPDYRETTNAIKKDKEEIISLKARLGVVDTADAFQEKVKTYQKEKSSYDEQIADAKKAAQIAKDTNGDVVTAQAELDRIIANAPQDPISQTQPKSTSSRVPFKLPIGFTESASTVVDKPKVVTGGGKGSTGSGIGSGTGSGTGGGKTTPPLTDAQQREEALNVAASEDFDLPETIFNNVPSLKRILDRYVKENWTQDKLRKAIRDDVWYRKNSAEIKARYVQLYNYRDLVATGQADGSTDYEKQILTLERQIADKARAVGSGIASDPAALRKAAENMYITNVGIDDAMTTDFIAAAIRPIKSTIGGQVTEGYSGQALKDYQTIQDVARSNGFRVKDIVPNAQTEQQVLQGIATGRIDANRLAQDARKLAAQGQPQYVRDLLGQGYNLDQVFAPYRQTMANLLELNADEIDLNDSTLRSAISDKGDMNIYDFKKTLKTDKRWQYTENAKSEVSDMTLKILRDFGFQG
jgi:hypothetical protein